jgi:hypothetical protein
MRTKCSTFQFVHYLEQHPVYQEPWICGFVWINDCAGLDFELLPNCFLQLQQKRRIVILHGFHLRINTSRPMRPAATIYQYMSRLPLWEAGLLKHMEFSPDLFTPVSINLSRSIQGVSDGLVWTDNQNSFGWTFHTDLGGQSARGTEPAQGS